MGGLVHGGQKFSNANIAPDVPINPVFYGMNDHGLACPRAGVGQNAQLRNFLAEIGDEMVAVPLKSRHAQEQDVGFKAKTNAAARGGIGGVTENVAESAVLCEDVHDRLAKKRVTFNENDGDSAFALHSGGGITGSRR